ALQLNPNFPEANHHLALTYEDLRDFDSAKAEYVKAVNAGFLRSVNNLARLQIVEEEDYESAAVLLLKALQSKERDREDAALEYGLRKNLGWAWLGQERLIKAQGELMKANKIEATLPEDRPDAYCLLAMTLEQQAAVNKQVAWQQGIPQPLTPVGEQAEGTSEVTKAWETCRQKIVRPEDDVWAAMADKALSVKAIAGKDPFTEPRERVAPVSPRPVERVYIDSFDGSGRNRRNTLPGLCERIFSCDRLNRKRFVSHRRPHIIFRAHDFLSARFPRFGHLRCSLGLFSHWC
ncbi:MAG: hypothetical protein AAGJ80_11525, partial [Cyanobacteria bacterium J06553_1]